MKQIDVGKNKVALVDDELFDELSQYEWRAEFLNNKWCVKRHALKKDGATEHHKWNIIMSRQISNAPSDMQVDHRNHNSFDNRRCSLRLATNSQNQMNRIRNPKSRFKYEGIVKYKIHSKYGAVITLNHKIIRLGYFATEHEAALAYDVAARKYFGEFALPNFGT